MAFKLALSAGHYLGTAGKNCPKELDPNRTKEWVLNNRIADKIEKILADYDGIEVLRLDDTTGRKYVSNEERANKSNSFGADFYLSIHHNAAFNADSGKTFSGGGIAAYIHNKNVKAGAAEWQKALYNAAVRATGLKGDRSTPLAKKALIECGAPKCPSVLMECGFMDSKVDCPQILSEAFADKIAKAFAEVIVEKSGATKKARTIYRVQVGAFSNPKYAETMLKKLNAAGFEGYITTM